MRHHRRIEPRNKASYQYNVSSLKSAAARIPSSNITFKALGKYDQAGDVVR